MKKLTEKQKDAKLRKLDELCADAWLSGAFTPSQYEKFAKRIRKHIDKIRKGA